MRKATVFLVVLLLLSAGCVQTVRIVTTTPEVCPTCAPQVTVVTATPPPEVSDAPPSIRETAPTLIPLSGTVATLAPQPVVGASPTRAGRAAQDPPGTPGPLVTAAATLTPAPEDEDNLLLNGGFEGAQYEQGLPEIKAPEHWTVFWYEGWATHDPRNDVGYSRPETRVIRAEPPYLDPPRIYAGESAFQAFAVYRVLDAGLMQTVRVTPGRRVALTAFAHAWSSGQDDAHSSDLVTQDDRDNIAFWVGIDPTGGQNWRSDNVIWSAPTQHYDLYGLVGPVEATAIGDRVTVFLRGRALWPLKHNDLYFDSARLRYVEEEAVAP
ncbi:MAG: hypothetical protein Kow00120_21030 [Anaerolineae bacterium]